jgi:hypothetical protein
MRNIKIVGLVFATVLMFSSLAATASFAAEILVRGESILGEIPFTITETFELEDMKATGPPTVLCSGSFDGETELGGALLLVTGVLTLSGEALGNLLECEDKKDICSSPVDVTAVNLPWDGEVENMVLGPEEYLLVLLNATAKDPGYTVDCNSILGLISDTCTAGSGGQQAVLKNETGGLLVEFSSSEATTPPGNCSVGGEKQGLVVGNGVLTSSSGALTVSR